jgi:hypothetical protein
VALGRVGELKPKREFAQFLKMVATPDSLPALSHHISSSYSLLFTLLSFCSIDFPHFFLLAKGYY